jgi:hypothetical protein
MLNGVTYIEQAVEAERRGSNQQASNRQEGYWQARN